MDNFKYLRVNINDKNNMHNEIQIMISYANRGRFTINKMISLKILSKGMKGIRTVGLPSKGKKKIY